MKLKRPSSDGDGGEQFFSSSSPTPKAAAALLNPAEATINDILACYEILSKLPSLEPSPKVNEVFSKLVSTCLREFDAPIEDKILSSTRIRAIQPHLLSICSKGESCLEVFWAQKIAGCSEDSNSSHGTNAVEVLSTFPYHSNYVDLTALELHALSSAIDLHHVRKIAFIGSGPLPLSSLCLLQQLPSQSCKAGRDLTAAACPDNDAPRVSILNIDREAEAIHLSRALTEKLGPAVAKSMRFVCAAVGDSSTSTLAELQTCDVVFVAALVGTSAEEKTHILERVAAGMRGGSLMVVRTAKGLKGLLYPIVDIEILPARMEIVTVVHPGADDGVVNSVIVARVREE